MQSESAVVTSDVAPPRRSLAFSRYRPRLLTTLLVLVVAALIALSNLSYDSGDYRGTFQDKSYGWPFTWHRFVIAVLPYKELTVGWYFSTGRLVANVAIWLVTLATVGLSCEWFLRRYQPRFCWSLRTMLCVVGLVAVFFAWLADALDRAKVQDRLTGTEYAGWLLSCSPHGFERWGPKWLDLLGVDRLRRHIVYGPMGLVDEPLFRQLARLSRLRWVSFEVTHFTPEMAASLNRMRGLEHLELEHVLPPDQTRGGTVAAAAVPSDQARGKRLRRLGDSPRLHALTKLTELTELKLNGFRIDGASLQGSKCLKSLSFVSPENLDQKSVHDCLAAIGNATQLEHLFISRMTIDRESVACLAGLTKLKTLCLENVESAEEPTLQLLPPLPRLECLHLGGQSFGDQDILQLAKFPLLKSLALKRTHVTSEGVAALASLDSLEELTMADEWRDPDGSRSSLFKLRSVLALKALRKLHLGRSLFFTSNYAVIMLDDGKRLLVPENDLHDYRQVVQSLRTAMPKLTIDGEANLIYESTQGSMPFKFSGDDWVVVRSTSWLPRSDVRWMTDGELAAFEDKGGWARFDAAGYHDDEGRITTVSF